MIKPALTAEEWGKLGTRDLDMYHYLVEWDGREHMIAAVALYGQPFGFTREDVKRVRAAAQMLESLLPVAGISDERVMGEVEQLRSLAARIEALLPPADP